MDVAFFKARGTNPPNPFNFRCMHEPAQAFSSWGGKSTQLRLSLPHQRELALCCALAVGAGACCFNGGVRLFVKWLVGK